MKRLLAFTVTALGCLILVSCAAEIAENYTDLRIRAVSCEQNTVLGPQESLTETARYVLHSSGPEGVSPIGDIVSLDGCFSLSSIRCGDWQFEIEQFNSVGTVLASGRVSASLVHGAGPVEIPLDRHPGEGILDLQLSCPYRATGSGESSVFVEARQTDTGLSYCFSRDEATASVNTRLSSGTYRLSAFLYTDGALISCTTTVLRLIADTPTVVALRWPELESPPPETAIAEPDDTDEGWSVTALENGSGEFVLVCNPAEDAASRGLRYEWYCDGELIASEGRICAVQILRCVGIKVLAYTDDSPVPHSAAISLRVKNSEIR